jgi:hypothetical protein
VNSSVDLEKNETDEEINKCERRRKRIREKERKNERNHGEIKSKKIKSK